MHRKTITGKLIACLLLASAFALAAAAEDEAVKGMISSRTGDTLMVRSESGNRTVVLNDETTTKDDTGLFGAGTEKLSDAVLIPGLKVHADGTLDAEGRIVAKTITVDGDDLETAEMIQAGLHPTEQQVAANMKAIEANDEKIHMNAQEIAAIKKFIGMYEQNAAAHKQQADQNIKAVEDTTNRFMALGDYDVKHQATVKFPVGSSTVSPQDQEQLKQFAQQAVQVTGYIVEVVGYADASGDAKMNEKLSDDRAKAVVAYLIQQAGVPVHRVVAPGAMGEYGPTASNETPAGRAENRRVEAKVLVNRGIAGN